MNDRAKFEAWDREQYDIDAETYARKYEGRFMDRAIQCRWECWQACRAQTMEEAAKLCDQMERRKWETIRDGGTLGGFGAKECGAAIRAASRTGDAG